MKTIILAGVSVAALGLVATGCTPTSSPEYVAYESVAEMDRAADQVVEVSVTSKGDGVIVSEFDSDDPAENPHAGTARDDMPSEGERSMDVIVYEAEILESYKGDMAVGDAISISQLPNVPDLAYLETGQTYVLFLATKVPGPAAIVGGDQGQYVLNESGLEPSSQAGAIELKQSDLEAIKASN